MIYAESFKYDYQEVNVNPNFVDVKSSQVAGIDLNDVIIDTDTPGTLAYIVKPGDTLSSLSKRFGTTVSHIKEVNNIKGKSLKPGEKILITEQPWIVFEAKEETNLVILYNQYNLAKHGIEIEDLQDLNYISNATEAIHQGDEVFFPLDQKKAKEVWLIQATSPNDGFDDVKKPVVVKNTQTKPLSKPTTTQTKPTTTTLTKPNVVATQPTNTNTQDQTPPKNKTQIVAQYAYSSAKKTRFARGFCTEGAALEFERVTGLEVDWWGNANAWLGNASKKGRRTGKTPAVNSIVVYRSGGGTYSSYWHVGVIKKINYADWTMLIKDSNYLARGVYTERYIEIEDNNIMWYIYAEKKAAAQATTTDTQKQDVN